MIKVGKFEDDYCDWSTDSSCFSSSIFERFAWGIK